VDDDRAGLRPLTDVLSCFAGPCNLTIYFRCFLVSKLSLKVSEQLNSVSPMIADATIYNINIPGDRLF
jgi:hypothetical protein